MTEPRLPQLDAAVFLTDGGIETTLIFDDGFDLPDFAAFTLLDSPQGREALTRYFESYVAIAARDRVGIVLETATWRANPDWAARQGYGTEALVRINRAAVELLEDIRARYQTAATPVVISGCIGPRGDGYRPDALMSASEAGDYHAVQAQAFAGSRADLITAITMTYPAEAIGVTEAARRVGMPAVISFTVETDGRLPTGESLADAIAAVDAATDGYPAYFMVNCAHPTHFADALRAGERLDAAHPRHAGQRLDDEPRRARRGRGARRRRPGRPRPALRRAAARPPPHQRARRLLRHEPPPHRRHQRGERRPPLTPRPHRLIEQEEQQ